MGDPVMSDSVIKRRMAGRPRHTPPRSDQRLCLWHECRLIWLILIGAVVMGFFGVSVAS